VNNCNQFSQTLRLEEVDHGDEELRDEMFVEQSSEICRAVSDIDAISLFDGTIMNVVFSHTLLLNNNDNFPA